MFRSHVARSRGEAAQCLYIYGVTDVVRFHGKYGVAQYTVIVCRRGPIQLLVVLMEMSDGDALQMVCGDGRSHSHVQV